MAVRPVGRTIKSHLYVCKDDFIGTLQQYCDSLHNYLDLIRRFSTEYFALLNESNQTTTL